MEQIDFAILGATQGEISPFSDSFPLSGKVEIAENAFTRHNYRNFNLLIGTTGIGKVNAAAITGAVLSRFKVSEVWNVGCAGAYTGAGLRIGDVFVTRESICGDEGILFIDRISSMEVIGIPLVQKESRPFYDRFSLGTFETFRKLDTLLPPGTYSTAGATNCLQPGHSDTDSNNSFALHYGPSLTVGMVSGDIETADKRFKNYAAMTENMEGSAIAQACFLFGASFLECRGISNIAGVRDKKQWNFNLAIDHSCAVIRHVLEIMAPAKRCA